MTTPTQDIHEIQSLIEWLVIEAELCDHSAERYQAGSPLRQTYEDRSKKFSQVVATLTKSSPVEAVAVKVLEWRKSNASDLWMADHPHGTEEIRFDFRADEKTQFGWFCRGQWCWFASLEEAKAAAQADYEARIRAALYASPLSNPEASAAPVGASRLIEEYRNLVRTGAEYAASELKLAPTSVFEIYMGHFRDIGRDIQAALVATPPAPTSAVDGEMVKALRKIARGDMTIFDEGDQCDVQVSMDIDEASKIATAALATLGERP